MKQSPEQIARDREARETPRSDPHFYTSEMRSRDAAHAARTAAPRLEMLTTVLRDQSGALYFVNHGEEPVRLGIDQSRRAAPPMMIAATASDFALVAEALCYEIVRHVDGTSRAAQLAHRVQHELARITPQGPDVRRRVRDGSKAA